MSFDPEAALSAAPESARITWTDRDVLLYHLSVGAGIRQGNPELPYIFEPRLHVLPTFAIVAGQGISSGSHPVMPLDILGLDIDMTKLLHAGQSLDVFQPIPTSGEASLATRVTNVWDKGKAAVVEVAQTATDSQGVKLWVATMQMWIRDAGGFGGESGPAAQPHDVEGEPDLTFTAATRADQAMLYRLNGDLNPLHVDPRFAQKAGLDRPILHGLASYGVIAKGLVDEVFGGLPENLTHLSGRFSGVLYPGERLTTRVWRRGEDVLFQTYCPDRGDSPVFSNGVARGALT